MLSFPSLELLSVYWLFKLRQDYKINLVLTGLSIVFAVFFAEVLFRFYLFEWDSFSIEKVNSVHDMGISGFIQPSPYPEIVYELKPDLSGYFKMVRFKTNSQGLRDKEYSIVRPNNTFRVAVIGDSFTMPAGVNIEMAYHTLLEKKFNQEQKDICEAAKLKTYIMCSTYYEVNCLQKGQISTLHIISVSISRTCNIAIYP